MDLSEDEPVFASDMQLFPLHVRGCVPAFCVAWSVL